jgi:hypothetical protein
LVNADADFWHAAKKVSARNRMSTMIMRQWRRGVEGTGRLGIWAFFRASRRRGNKLRKLSRVLGAAAPVTVESLFHRHSASEAAEEELYAVIEGDPTLHAIIEKYAASRADLRNLYHLLIRSGAGQWAGGHWVPASAICYGFTLEFVLSTLHKQTLTREACISAAIDLVEYFREGRVGRV